MAMSEWGWDAARRAYRRLDGPQVLAAARIKALRQEFTRSLNEHAAGLAGQLVNGPMTLSTWEGAMLRLVRASYLAQALLGRGGVNEARPAEVARWKRHLAQQQAYLSRWSQDLAQPAEWATATAAGITARAALYFAAGNAAFEEARAQSFGVPALPQYPADGSQECLSNCQCSWEIEETADGWECTWELEPGAHHCGTCTTNAEQWSPLIIGRADADGTNAPMNLNMAEIMGRKNGGD